MRNTQRYGTVKNGQTFNRHYLSLCISIRYFRGVLDRRLRNKEDEEMRSKDTLAYQVDLCSEEIIKLKKKMEELEKDLEKNWVVLMAHLGVKRK